MRLTIDTEGRTIEVSEECTISELINAVNDAGLDFDEWYIGERARTKLEEAVEEYQNITNSTADIETNYDLCTD